MFAKNNVDVDNYISNGEVRFGLYGLAASTIAHLRIDMVYMILGATNTDNTQCEISFGSGTVGNCSNTRDIDTTLALANYNTWQNTSGNESTAMSHDYYAYDNDADATATDESATSSNL